MLNTCPKWYSCGTVAGMWTDEAMSNAIGVPTNVTTYGSASSDYTGNCKDFTIQVEVIRCSIADNDFIYRHISNSIYGTRYPETCDLAFCGMM